MLDLLGPHNIFFRKKILESKSRDTVKYVKLLGAADTAHGSKAGNYVVMEDRWHRGRKVKKMVMVK